jgi:predicted GNAT family acetyltransferase
LELTSIAYPHYFRPGTARLGPYFGVWEGERLVAMAGVRMAMPGWQELSAVCTHPEHRGRGLATTLSLRVVHEVLSAGDTPFLHTESDNPAREMYRKLGFRERALLPIRVLRLTETRGMQ